MEVYLLNCRDSIGYRETKINPNPKPKLNPISRHVLNWLPRALITVPQIMTEKLEKVLSDPLFLEVKCQMGLYESILSDFSLAYSVLGLGVEKGSRIQVWGNFLRRERTQLSVRQQPYPLKS